MAQDNYQIIERILDVPLFVQHQRLLPIGIGEVGICLFHALRRKLRLHGIILYCKIRHSSKGLFLIVAAIFVYTHEVKSVEQLSASRVCRMMAVRKLIIINNDTGGAFAGDIIVAAFHD
ncbi:MAG: hypothetical protein BWY11_00425 [Firmicutes bacterium ADurb.Bin182]|nr:MAG: hypothetical protein BWY11_00425 [Firmicutes bacterium ADurb.Bin182]